MKKRILFILLTASAFAFANCYAKAQEQALDQVVAVVNDDVVTKSELTHALKITKSQISQANLPVPAENVLQKQVLDQLINKKLQLQIAKQAGIQVEDSDMERAVQMIANQNQITVDMLYQKLSEEGMDVSEYRNEIHDQLVMQKLQQQEVINRIHIAPEEVTRFLQSKAWRNNGSKEYHLEDILVPISDTPSTEELVTAKKRAEMLLVKLKQGQNFQSLAQAESGDKHALEGGDLGWRKLPEIPSAFADHVVQMQPKDIAGPIQTPNGYHLIRLVSSRNAEAAAPTPDRKQVEQLLMQRKFEEAVQSWVSKLRSQAFISTQLA